MKCYKINEHIKQYRDFIILEILSLCSSLELGKAQTDIENKYIAY